jgi:predicted nucleic-acid-binding protein
MPMRITADTNVLLRAILDDHPTQSPRAQAMLRDAETVAVSLPTLCEFVWVLRQGYRRTRAEVVSIRRALLDTANLSIDRPAVEAGIEIGLADGDFADGVIAFEGRRLGGAIFVTFDQKAAPLLRRAGVDVTLLDPNR